MTTNERCSDPIVEANVDMLRSRSRVGLNKYGITLADAELTTIEYLQLALEETLDLANYLRSAIIKLKHGTTRPDSPIDQNPEFK